MARTRQQQTTSKSARLWPLLAVNFFMADMQSGIGPFVGVFLLERGWASGMIGTAMAMGNIAGMLIATPVGGFIDTSRHKRAWIIVPGIAVVAASSIILLWQNFWAVAASQIATSIAGAAIVPAVTGITLGIVGQRGFNRQNGRNQAFNHAGNMVGAAASGLLGWQLGYFAVFALAALFGAITVACVLLIPSDAINPARRSDPPTGLRWRGHDRAGPAWRQSPLIRHDLFGIATAVNRDHAENRIDDLEPGGLGTAFHDNAGHIPSQCVRQPVILHASIRGKKMHDFLGQLETRLSFV
jgi:MFS family permease